MADSTSASAASGPALGPVKSRFSPDDTVLSWGRVIRAAHQVAKPAFSDELPGLMEEFTLGEPGLATGLRRSYGDTNLNPGGRLIDMTGLDRISALSAKPA